MNGLLWQLQNDRGTQSKELDVKFQLAKDTLETMLKSMYCIRDQLSNIVCFTLSNLLLYLPFSVSVHITLIQNMQNDYFFFFLFLLVGT